MVIPWDKLQISSQKAWEMLSSALLTRKKIAYFICAEMQSMPFSIPANISNLEFFKIFVKWTVGFV